MAISEETRDGGTEGDAVTLVKALEEPQLIPVSDPQKARGNRWMVTKVFENRIGLNGKEWSSSSSVVHVNSA